MRQGEAISLTKNPEAIKEKKDIKFNYIKLFKKIMHDKSYQSQQKLHKEIWK